MRNPTVAFGVILEIPDELFSQASKVIGEFNIGMKDAHVSSEFVVPEGITVKAQSDKSENLHN